MMRMWLKQGVAVKLQQVNTILFILKKFAKITRTGMHMFLHFIIKYSDMFTVYSVFTVKVGSTGINL